MGFLESGTYEPRTTKTVTVWPKPDHQGDGPEVFEDVTDPDGNFLRRDLVTDQQGRPVREYNPPNGFIHVPTREPGADRAAGAWVRDDGHGRPKRAPNGHAVGIKPGTALVEHGDGTFELLPDDYSQAQFARAHSIIGDPRPADQGDQNEQGGQS